MFLAGDCEKRRGKKEGNEFDRGPAVRYAAADSRWEDPCGEKRVQKKKKKKSA